MSECLQGLSEASLGSSPAAMIGTLAMIVGLIAANLTVAVLLLRKASRTLSRHRAHRTSATTSRRTWPVSPDSSQAGGASSSGASSVAFDVSADDSKR